MACPKCNSPKATLVEVGVWECPNGHRYEFCVGADINEKVRDTIFGADEDRAVAEMVVSRGGKVYL